MRSTRWITLGLLFAFSYATAQPMLNKNVSFQDVLEVYMAEMEDLQLLLPSDVFYGEGGPYSDFMKWNDTWGSRTNANGTFEGYFEAQLRSIDEVNSGDIETISNSSWQEIGPTIVPGYLNSNVPALAGGDYGIGPIEFIRFSSLNHDEMLCGSTVGGLFYSSDGGDNWANAGSDLQWKRSDCGWAEFHPSDAGTWYAMNAGRGSTGPGYLGVGGLHRTTDFGATWNTLADQSLFGEWTFMEKAALNMIDPDQLVIATSWGIFRTDNLNDPVDDVIWDHIIQPIPNANYVFDLMYMPGTAGTYFATVRYTNGSGGHELIRSDDGGMSWTIVANKPADVDLVTSLTLAYSPADPGRVFIFASDAFNGNENRLYSLHFDSSIWNQIPTPTGASNNTYRVDFGSGRGFSVSTFDPEKIVFTYRADNIASTSNGGGTWQQITGTSNVANGNIRFHDDLEHIVFHPDNPDEYWIATHGGLYRTVDFGTTWERRSIGLGVAQVFSLSTSKSSDEQRLMAGLYHDGCLFNDGTGWFLVGDGDGMQVLVDDDNVNRMYASFQGPQSPNSSSTHTLTNSSWASSSAISTGIGLAVEWRTHGTLNSSSQNLLYTHRHVNNRPEIVRCDNGVNCVQISDFITNFPTSGNVQILGTRKMFSSTVAPDRMYAHMLVSNSGTQDTRLLLCPIAQSNDINAIRASWIELPLPIRPDNAQLAGMAFDEADENVVYLSYKSLTYPTSGPGVGMVYRADYTNPANPVIVDITYNLPPAGVGNWHDNTIVSELGAYGGLYLGTDVGVFYTNSYLLANDPEPWKCFGTGLPHVEVFDLEIDYANNILIVGTMGRGVWMHDLVCPPELTLNVADADVAALNGNYVFGARETVTSDAVVGQLPHSISFVAGQEVIMSPPFSVSAVQGETFQAYIRSCENPAHQSDRIEAPSDPRGGKYSAVEFKEPILPAGRNLLYPNPTTGLITLQAPEAVATVQVLELTGRVLQTLAANGSTTVSIDLSPYQPGTYLLRAVYASGKAEVWRVVRQ